MIHSEDEKIPVCNDQPQQISFPKQQMEFEQLFLTFLAQQQFFRKTNILSGSSNMNTQFIL